MTGVINVQTTLITRRTQCGRAFSYAGPSAWNFLPAHLRSQNVTMNNFRHSLKTFLFSQMIHAAH